MSERPDAVSRRSLLKGAGVLVAMAGTQVAVATPAAAATTPPSRDTLLYVFLRGGLDGLNTVVPAGDPLYRAARPSVAVPASALLPLDLTFGMHPALAPLKPLWDAKQLAFVHAVGNPEGGRSHFEAQDAIDCGVSRPSAARTGWIARHLASSASAGSPLRALGVDSNKPLSLHGPIDPVSTRELDNFGLDVGPATLAHYEPTMRALYSGFSHPLAATAASTLAATAKVRSLGTSTYVPAAGAAYPDTDLGAAVRQVAMGMKLGGGIEAATIDVDGYDLHTDLGAAGAGKLAVLLDDLARSLMALRTDLGPLWSKLTVVVVSEFGRRLDENGDGGTDHGHGGLMTLLGGNVNGGKVYTRWPGLADSQLVHGDLAVTTDFRDVLAEVVSLRLGNGANLSSIFPGHVAKPLGVVRRTATVPRYLPGRRRPMPTSGVRRPWHPWRRA